MKTIPFSYQHHIGTPSTRWLQGLYADKGQLGLTMQIAKLLTHWNSLYKRQLSRNPMLISPHSSTSPSIMAILKQAVTDLQLQILIDISSSLHSHFVFMLVSSPKPEWGEETTIPLRILHFCSRKMQSCRKPLAYHDGIQARLKYTGNPPKQQLDSWEWVEHRQQRGMSM